MGMCLRDGSGRQPGIADRFCSGLLLPFAYRMEVNHDHSTTLAQSTA